MRITGTNSLQGLLALGLMNGLVACGSFANCFNSGFAPAACGGGYSESNASSLPRPMSTSAEGRWTGVTSHRPSRRWAGPGGRLVLAVLFGTRQSQRPGWTGSGYGHVARRLLRFLKYERF
jgi:hypothetical protein